MDAKISHPKRIGEKKMSINKGYKLLIKSHYNNQGRQLLSFTWITIIAFFMLLIINPIWGVILFFTIMFFAFPITSAIEKHKEQQINRKEKQNDR